MAIERVFAEHARRVLLTAPKSVVGHTLGAAGAFSVVTGALMLRHGIVPPVLNLTHLDPECRINAVVGQAWRGHLRALTIHAFGFGGQNAVLVLEHA